MQPKKKQYSIFICSALLVGKWDDMCNTLNLPIASLYEFALSSLDRKCLSRQFEGAK